MHDAVGAAPLRQYSHKRTRGQRIPALRSRQQDNSSPLACCRYQKIETVRRKARLNHHGTGVPVLRRQKPGVAALLLLMEDGKLAKVSRCRGLPFFRQKGRTCDENPPAYADPFHLQVGVSVKAFANPDRHIDTLVNEIDPPVGHDTLEPQQRMGGKKARHRSRDRALEAERAAQSNKTARFSLHSKRGLLRGFSLDDRSPRMLEDLLANLGQTKPSRSPIEQPHAEPLLQQSDATADS